MLNRCVVLVVGDAEDETLGQEVGVLGFESNLESEVGVKVFGTEFGGGGEDEFALAQEKGRGGREGVGYCLASSFERAVEVVEPAAREVGEF